MELTIFFSTLGAIDSVIPVFGGVVSRIEGIIWIAALFEDAATPSYYPIQPIQPFGNTLWEGIIDHSGGAWNPDEIIEMIDLYYMR
jgi:hypothetical protein